MRQGRPPQGPGAARSTPVYNKLLSVLVVLINQRHNDINWIPTLYKRFDKTVSVTEQAFVIDMVQKYVLKLIN